MRENTVTIGYQLNKNYLDKKIASNALILMAKYFINNIGITALKTHIMPENLYYSKILLNNGFLKDDYTLQEKNWGGQEIVSVDVYTFRQL